MHCVLIVAIFLTANLFACLCVAGPQQAAMPTDQTEPASEVGARVADLIKRAHETLGFSGVVLIAIDGEVVAKCAAGYADLENEQPIQPDTLFEIGSTTKLFTALAVCQLAEQGKLDLDDPMAKYLPGVPEDCSQITIRHLLQHTSGIPGTNTSGHGDDLEAVLPIFLEGGTVRDPGTHHEYWNQGYALLSEIVARTSDTTYVDYCRENIFNVAGMSHTRFTGDPAPDDALVATGLSGNLGPPRTALEHPYGSYGFQYRGMGGMVTNMNDLWRWDRAMAANEIISAETFAEMQQPGLGNYGLGMYVLRNHQGEMFHGHGGKVRGFKCKLRRYHEHDGCVILLSNRDNNVPDIVLDYLETILFAEGVPLQLIPNRPTDEQADKFLGTYVCDNIGMEIEIKRDGELIASHLRMPGRPDQPASPLYLGTNDAGRYVVLAEQIHDLPVTESDDGKIGEITFINRVFTRR